MPNGDPRKSLYDALNSNEQTRLLDQDGNKISFEQYSSILDDPEQAKGFYESVSQVADIGEYDSFLQKVVHLETGVPEAQTATTQAMPTIALTDEFLNTPESPFAPNKGTYITEAIRNWDNWNRESQDPALKAQSDRALRKHLSEMAEISPQANFVFHLENLNKKRGDRSWEEMRQDDLLPMQKNYLGEPDRLLRDQEDKVITARKMVELAKDDPKLLPELQERLRQEEQNLIQAKDNRFKNIDLELIERKAQVDSLTGLKKAANLQRIDELEQIKEGYFKTPEEIYKENQEEIDAKTEELIPGATAQQKVQLYFDALTSEHDMLTRILGQKPGGGERGAFSAITQEMGRALPTGELLSIEVENTNALMKRLDEVRSELKVLAPVALLNRQPNIEKDSPLDVLAKSFVNTAANQSLPTEQQRGMGLQKALGVAGVPQTEVSRKGQTLTEAAAAPYESWSLKSIANTVGTSAGIIAPVAIGSMATSGSKGMQVLAKLAKDGTLKASKAPGIINKANRGLIRAFSEGARTGVQFQTAGALFPNQKDELNFMSGFLGGTVGKTIGSATNYIPGIRKVFGSKAGKAVKKIMERGAGEVGEEFAQETYQIWSESENFQTFKDEMEKRFGTFSDASFFVASTFLMGSAMGGGQQIGEKSASNAMLEASREAYDKLSPEEKVEADKIMGAIAEDAAATDEAIVEESEKISPTEPAGEQEAKVEESTEVSPEETTIEPEVEKTSEPVEEKATPEPTNEAQPEISKETIQKEVDKRSAEIDKEIFDLEQEYFSKKMNLKDGDLIEVPTKSNPDASREYKFIKPPKEKGKKQQSGKLHYKVMGGPEAGKWKPIPEKEQRQVLERYQRTPSPEVKAKIDALQLEKENLTESITNKLQEDARKTQLSEAQEIEAQTETQAPPKTAKEEVIDLETFERPESVAEDRFQKSKTEAAEGLEKMMASMGLLKKADMDDSRKEFVEGLKMFGRGLIGMGAATAENVWDKIKAKWKESGSDVNIDDFRDEVNFEPAKVPGPESKKRGFYKSLEDNPNISEEFFKGISEKGKSYIPISNEITVAESDAIIEEKGSEKAFSDVKNEKNAMQPRVRTRIAISLIQQYETDAAKESDETKKNELYDKASEVGEWATQYGTRLGQGVQAFATMATYTPTHWVREYTKTVEKKSEATKRRKEPRVKEQKKEIKQTRERTARQVAKAAKEPKVLGMTKTELRSKKFDALNKFKNALKGKAKTGIDPEALAALAEYGYYLTAEGVITFKEWSRRMIADTGASKEDVKKAWTTKHEDKSPREFSEARSKSIEKIVVSHYKESGKTVKDLAASIEESGVDPEEATNLAKSIDKAYKSSLKRNLKTTLGNKPGLIEGVVNATSEAEVENLLYGSDKLEVDPDFVKKIRGMGEEMMKLPEGRIRNQAAAGIMNEIAKKEGLNWGDVAWSMWYANILSGIDTQKINAVSNIQNTFMEGSVSVIRQAIINKDITATAALMKGLMKGYARGWVEAGNIWRTGETRIQDMKYLEVKNALEQIRFKGGAFNPANYSKYVSRAMMATDAFFYEGLNMMRRAEVTREEARKKGISGKKLNGEVAIALGSTKEAKEYASEKATQELDGKGFSKRQVKLRAMEILDNEVNNEIKEASHDFASFGTFNYEPKGVLGAIANIIANMNRSVKITRVVVPFTRVVANVLNQQIDYTPYGFARAWGGISGLIARNSKMRDAGLVSHLPVNQEAKQRQLIKASLGTMAMATYLMLDRMSADDEDPFFQINGRGPLNFNKKGQLYSRGWKPFSIKIGDQYISYQYSPAGIALATIGNFADAIRYGDLSDAEALDYLAYMVINSASVVKDYSFLSGAQELIETLGEKEKASDFIEKGTKFLARRAGSVIPNLFKQFDKMTNPQMYDAPDIKSAIMREIPWVRSMLQPKLNALGEEVKKKDNIIFGKLVSTHEPHPVWDLLARKKAWVPAVSRTTKIDGEPITPQEYRRLVKEHGALLKEEIMRRNNYWSNLPKQEFQKKLNMESKRIKERVKQDIYIDR